MYAFKLYLLSLLAGLTSILPAVAQNSNNLPASALTDTGRDVRALGLPTVVVETEGGKEPDCTPVTPPEGCTGNSITDNKYIKGRLWIIDGDHLLYDSGSYDKGMSGMRIKVRGNSSAYTTHKSEKIKLETKADLLLRDDQKGEHKEWGLLNYFSTCDLKTMLGLWLGREVGKSWEPEYQWVNLLQNGQYKGIYLLSELITEGEGRCELEDDELLVEANPYWWTEEQVVLHTEHLPYALAYTFKYPDDMPSNEQFLTLKNSLTKFEQTLHEEPERLAEYMDMESFARWVMVHDLLGTLDGYGSNIYLVVSPQSTGQKLAGLNDDNDSEKNETDEATDNDGEFCLRMGPLWDFGSAFEMTDKWAAIHTLNDFYFPLLFKQPAFAEVYARVWNEVRNDLQDNVSQMLNAFAETHGKALERSRNYQNAALNAYPMMPLTTQLAETNEWMVKRIAWMDAAIEEMLVQNGVEHPEVTNNPVTGMRLYNLSGQLVARYAPAEAENLLRTNRLQGNLPAGVYVLEVTRSHGAPQRLKRLLR